MVVNFAKLMTVGVLFLLIGMVWDTGTENMHTDGWLICAAWFLGCCLNFAALHQKSGGEKIINIWPFIMFRRLTLQEKKRIEELQK